MNYANVVKSFFLGLVIGLVLQSVGPAVADISLRFWSVLAAGGLGLLIGLVTEWVTWLLPIRIARTRTYFLVNNAIAVGVTASVMVLLTLFTAPPEDTASGWWPLIAVAVGIVCVANLVEYWLYRRTQRRLSAMKARLTSDR